MSDVSHEIAEAATTTERGTFLVITDDWYRDIRWFREEVPRSVRRIDPTVSEWSGGVECSNGSKILLVSASDVVRIRGMITDAYWLAPHTDRCSLTPAMLDELSIQLARKSARRA